jgi:hypothetical protein
MENNELTQNQILVEIKRISKNIQFFFWLTIASIGFSLITAIYFSSGSNDSTSSSNDSTKERDKTIKIDAEAPLQEKSTEVDAVEADPDYR